MPFWKCIKIGFKHNRPLKAKRQGGNNRYGKYVGNVAIDKGNGAMQLPGDKHHEPNNTAGYKPSVEQGFHLARYQAY